MRASSRTWGFSSSPKRGTPVTRLKCMSTGLGPVRQQPVDGGESWSGSNCEGGVVGVMKAPAQYRASGRKCRRCRRRICSREPHRRRHSGARRARAVDELERAASKGQPLTVLHHAHARSRDRTSVRTAARGARRRPPGNLEVLAPGGGAANHRARRKGLETKIAKGESRFSGGSGNVWHRPRAPARARADYLRRGHIEPRLHHREVDHETIRELAYGAATTG